MSRNKSRSTSDYRATTGSSYYGEDSPSEYTSGKSKTSSRAPSMPSVPAFSHPPSVQSTSKEPALRYDSCGHSYTELRDEVCGQVIANIYTENGGPWNGKSQHHTDSNNRIKYTTFHDGQTGKELARVYADPGDGPCSWHGGTTARGPVSDIHNGGFSGEGSERAGGFVDSDREGSRKGSGNGGSRKGESYSGSGHHSHNPSGVGSGASSRNHHRTPTFYNGFYTGYRGIPRTDSKSSIVESYWSELSLSDSASNAGKKSGSWQFK